MKLKITLMLVIITLMMVTLVSANLGTFKQNECVNIRVLGNCSSINLSEVTINNLTYTLNTQMTKNGQTFNYTFCNTSIIGHYTYSWNNPCIDCSTYDCGNDFTITSTGYEPSISQSMTIFILIAVLTLTIILLFIFGISSNYLPAKILCLSLSVLLIVFTIGYILQIANINLAEYTSLTNGFTPLYVIFVTLLIAGGLGIVIYMIVTVFKNFQKTRYGIGE